MRLALVASAHGFGHFTRSCALAETLVRQGHAVTLFTAGPPGFVPTGVAHRPWTVDVGLVQLDSVTEDIAATGARVDEVCSDARIDALAGELTRFDRVVVDVAPAALEAARRAGRPAVAVGNFDWAWIYAHYPELSRWAARFAAWQAPHPGVSLWPGPGLRGFADVGHVGVMGRRAEPVRVAARSVVVSFGGFGLDRLAAMLPRLPGVTWVFAAPMRAPPRDDCVQVDDVPFPALVAGADLVLTKPGYGIYAEAALAGTPVVWLDRPGFPEAPWLERAFVARGDLKVTTTLADAVVSRIAGPRPAPLPSATETVATHILHAT